MVAKSAKDSALYHVAWEASCRSHAVIEFALDGSILWANEAFLATMGYALPEGRGRHHRMFRTREDAASSANAAFWENLGRGAFDGGLYRRIDRRKRELWLQATCNPILDADGVPRKIVKIATHLTRQVVMVLLSRIVGSIGDISARTRPVALTAAIEAARAAEAGSGFAIIAREVKSLAKDIRAATEQAAAMLRDDRETAIAA